MDTIHPTNDQPDCVLVDQDQTGPTVARMRIGAQLRRLREGKGITLEDAASEIRASASKMSRLELGRHGLKRRDVDDLLTFYGVTDPDERKTLLTLAKQANAPGWWHPLADVVPGWFEPCLGLEQAAAVIRTFDPQVVPALLQTAGYARTIIRLSRHREPETQLERRVSLQMGRQCILHRPDPPRVWAVVDEGALRRPAGGTAIMRAQLTHLIETAALPHVTVQVLPFRAGGHPALGGAVAFLRLPESILPDIVYLEQLDNARYLDKPSDVARYQEILDRLAVVAAPRDASIRVLRRILADI